MALIELRSIKKSFKMGSEIIQALDGVNLDIQQGEFVSIIGPSGSGKSTLMNIIGLLDKPTSGTYQLDSKYTETFNDNESAKYRNQKIGFVFQSFNLLPRVTALRNIEMPLVYSASYSQNFSRAKIHDMALEALEKVGLGNRADHKPNELSGGQRQRVAIARALVNHPKLLLADEPTGNLDSKSGLDILSLFEDLHRQGVTIILVTHDPRIAARTNHMIEIMDGKVKQNRYASE